MINMTRILIILFSALTIPYTVRLIGIVMKDDILAPKKTPPTAYILISLFISLFVIATSSMTISGLSLLREYGIYDPFFRVDGLSRVRSLLTAVANFLVSYHFYRVTKKV